VSSWGLRQCVSRKQRGGSYVNIFIFISMWQIPKHTLIRIRNMHANSSNAKLFHLAVGPCFWATFESFACQKGERQTLGSIEARPPRFSVLGSGFPILNTRFSELHPHFPRLDVLFTLAGWKRHNCLIFDVLSYCSQEPSSCTTRKFLMFL